MYLQDVHLFYLSLSLSLYLLLFPHFTSTTSRLQFRTTYSEVDPIDTLKVQSEDSKEGNK